MQLPELVQLLSLLLFEVVDALEGVDSADPKPW